MVNNVINLKVVQMDQQEIKKQEYVKLLVQIHCTFQTKQEIYVLKNVIKTQLVLWMIQQIVNNVYSAVQKAILNNKNLNNNYLKIIIMMIALKSI